MSLPNNFVKFPNNVSVPTDINIKNEKYTLYKFKFSGLQDFYDFLKSNPSINASVWRDTDKIASIEEDYSFAGIPYENAIEKLIEEEDPGYQEYLRIQKAIKSKEGYTHKYKEIKSIAGGIINPIDYISGSPTIYRASRIIKQPKFITIDTQVAYHCGTSKSQVFNRALIIANLIRALERNGYIVDLNSFMIVENDNEIIEAIFELKKQNQKINYQSLYKSLVDVEFFRRLCFRLIEISDVTKCWYSGYGCPTSELKAKELLKLKKDDIYFDQPSNMGIYGKSIESDFENVIEILGLQDTIDVEKEKQVLKNSIKVLRK